jgi:hypothetical protein
LSKQTVSANHFKPGFGNIAIMLNLKPIIDWHVWEDDHKNKLTISKKRVVYITESGHIPNTTDDVHIKSNPRLILSRSYWVVYVKSDLEYIGFLGLDGRLRVSVFNGGWVHNVKPMVMGYNFLEYVSNNFLERDITNFKCRIFCKGAVEAIGWSSGLPIQDKYKEEHVCQMIKKNS